MSGANMNQLLTDLKSIQEELNTSYESLSGLLSRIESEQLWKGKEETTFLAYMGLMQQYHKCFTGKTGENPVQMAIDALKAHEERVNDFYTDFQEYKDMEGI